MLIPERPPIRLPRVGFWVFKSIVMPRRVLISARTSAPPLIAAWAISAMSVTLGVSFTMSVLVPMDLLTLVTKCSNTSQEHPNSIPPASIFGQETFNSIASISSLTASIEEHVTYSSMLEPATLAIIGTSNERSLGISRSRNNWIPLFSRPIELRSPALVSTIRGSGLPARGNKVTLFVTTAPTYERLWIIFS